MQFKVMVRCFNRASVLLFFWMNLYRCFLDPWTAMSFREQELHCNTSRIFSDRTVHLLLYCVPNVSLENKVAIGSICGNGSGAKRHLAKEHPSWPSFVLFSSSDLTWEGLYDRYHFAAATLHWVPKRSGIAGSSPKTTQLVDTAPNFFYTNVVNATTV